MTRRRLRAGAVGFWAVLLAVCSDDPAITAPPPATPSPPPLEGHAAERAALMALYDATNGTHWHEQGNWNTAGVIRNWRGVSTNPGGFVTELSLPNNNLTGTLPPELGDLPYLRRLVLRANDLSGTLPRRLGTLSRLTRLDLSGNNLNGTIPSELGSLSNLTYLNLSRNELTGGIPPELAKLGAIRTLSVSRNNLTGTIPPELENLAALEGLYLYQNQLTGGIPVSLTNLSELETLWIHDNGLSGPLIEGLTNLRALEDLRAGGNHLSGSLPRDLGSLQALTRLELEGNQDLAGLLPRSMTGLEFLRTLSYGATDLCAQVDHEFQEWLRTIPEVSSRDCDVRQVERLALTDLYDATGGPSWVTRSAWGTDAPLGDWYGVSTQDGGVVEVALSGNGLTGPLPPEIANLTELRAVDLADNDLSGPFPRSIAGLPELAELRLDRNPGLEGVLPFAFRELARVRVLLHDETGLCASPAPDFQAWYAAIEQTTGAVCENPDQVTVSLPMVYLTQSVQAPSGDVRLVANRDALLRAFVTAEGPRGFFEPEVVAVFTGPDGGEVHRVVMTRDANQIPAEAEEGDLGQSYNAVIPAEVIVPGVEMVVRIDPGGALPLTAESGTRFPEEGRYSPNVVEVPPMQLTLVPVMEAQKPDTSVLEWVSGISAGSPEVGLLRHAFPFAEFRVVQRSPYYTSLDPTTESGRIALVGEIEMLRATEGGTGHYYGVVASMGSIAGWAQRPGWVSVGIASPTTLAHEVGHNLSLRHAPCGDPGNVDLEFPYPDGSIGVWGYDFRNGSLVPPDRGQDIMTYCRLWPWLSDYYFEQVIDYRAQLAVDAQSAPLAALDPPSDKLVLWGGVLDGELWIEPVFWMHAAPRLPEAPGPYRIRGTTSDGGALFSLDFTPTEDAYGGRHFFFAVPIQAGWEDALERITLTGPEGQAYTDQTDERRITVVSEPGTGRLRAILRDWEESLPGVLRDAASLDVSTTRGLKERR